jgi:predicted AlkP superfamily pyrophosphatase or phosphodiesterase
MPIINSSTLKKIAYLLVLFLLSYSCVGTKDKERSPNTALRTNPKLVVGIVVDQMRYDYLTRFESHFGDDGFKRMLNEGFNCKNNHFNYIPTYTGPGHASVYTGTTPKHHGIISNNWYDKELKTSVYCASDFYARSVGTESRAGKMSPKRMLATSFADENRLFTQLRGKTIGIALKDRGAILPAGHTANAAYWFHGADEGQWITSDFYMEELPAWVKEFNASNRAADYFKTWDTYKPIATYEQSGSDLNDFEGGFKGKDTATFPYDLDKLKDENGGFDILKTTPFGNSLTLDFAIEAIKGEQLGKDEDTDVLALSFSSTDYVGHNFGANSKEVQDTYVRLDKDLERLFQFLDDYVGRGEYTVFLTADHGAVDVPSYLQSLKIPSGYLNNSERKALFTKFLIDTYGTEKIVENVSNNQIFLNTKELERLNLNKRDVAMAIADEQLTYQNVAKVFTAPTLVENNFTDGIESLLQNGYNQKRSGDVIFVDDIAYISYSPTGSTHGSGLNYDTHVPLLFYGKGIRKGSTTKKTVIPDIAPTISALLGISFPNAATGQPISEVID